MSVLSKLKAFVSDPPPEFAFEISGGGIAWARCDDPARVQWAPLAEGVLEVTPLEDNVKRPEAFAATVRNLIPAQGAKKPRRAALILPDYCARIAVVDFDTFPSDPQEQVQLARFRVKRAVPFDIDSALVACYPQFRKGNDKRTDVVVAVVNMEVASHYQAPFRAAGFHCGFVTVSALSSLSLRIDDAYENVSPVVVAKLSGRVLAVGLLEGPTLRMFRCVELAEANEHELMEVLAPTFAFCEDEVGAKPKALALCGVPRLSEDTRQRWSGEFGLPVCGVRSRHGAPAAFNAGLYGYLEGLEAN